MSKDILVMRHMKALGLAAAFAGSFGLATAAHAAPIGLISSDGIESSTLIEQVAFGCGQGWVPNAWGECRPNYPRPYWGGYGYRPPPPPPPYWGGYGYRRPPPPVGFYGGPRPYPFY